MSKADRKLLEAYRAELAAQTARETDSSPVSAGPAGPDPEPAGQALATAKKIPL
ncbi:hypothetical protein HKX41_10825 [Salinisphaera sp. USBA-960]|nr:hypothetical protein [Salifodinibacter halophilus]